MEPNSSGPVDFVSSLRSLVDGLLASVQERIELFGVEFQEEKLRLIQPFLRHTAGDRQGSGMYPQKQLIRLSAHKVSLRCDIALRRIQCSRDAARVIAPLAWFDRLLRLGRRLSMITQIAAVPLGMLVFQSAFSRLKILRALVRFGPLVFSAALGLRSVIRAHRSPRHRASVV